MGDENRNLSSKVCGQNVDSWTVEGTEGMTHFFCETALVMAVLVFEYIIPLIGIL